MNPVVRCLGVMLVLSLCPHAAEAQKYPDRPVKVVVPYTPGGGTDTVARALTQRLSELWGQPVVVENRPGAGTTLGADAVAKASPDGYTLLFTDTASFVINPHIYEKMPFDPLKDLAPIALAVRLTHPCRDGILQAPRRHRHSPRAVSRHDPGDDRPARRPRQHVHGDLLGVRRL